MTARKRVVRRGERSTSTGRGRASAIQALDASPEYAELLSEVSGLLEAARRTTSRAVNSIMTAMYWEIGRRIVTEEQRGRRRAEYGEALIESLSADLTARFGRGFSATNLFLMRQFFSTFGPADGSLELPPHTSSPIPQTLSEEFIAPTAADSAGAPEALESRRPALPLTWSHYVRLLQVRNDHARRFYEAEALRGGWTVRQLDRQIDAQFYERTALSRNKAAILRSGFGHARRRDQGSVRSRVSRSQG